MKENWLLLKNSLLLLQLKKCNPFLDLPTFTRNLSGTTPRLQNHWYSSPERNRILNKKKNNKQYLKS